MAIVIRTTASIPLKPSRDLQKAARTASLSSHALVNLIRLVKALDKNDPDYQEESSLDPTSEYKRKITLRRDWEVCPAAMHR